MKTLRKPVKLVPAGKDKVPEKGKNFAAALAKLGKVGEKRPEKKAEPKPDTSGPYNAKMLALARSRLMDRDPMTEAKKAETEG